MLTDKIITSKYMLLRIISFNYLMSQGCLLLQRSVCHFNGKMTQQTHKQNTKRYVDSCVPKLKKVLDTQLKSCLKYFLGTQYFRFSSEYIQNSPVSTQKSFKRAVF